MRAPRLFGRGAAAPAPGRYEIDTGFAELVRDRDRPTGFMLFVNGVESSHADVADPAWLEFEYLQWTAKIIRAGRSGRAFEVLHLGAAGCSLARSLIATEPASRHLAVDIDARLAALVRDWFDLPRAPVLRLRVGDAREVTEALRADSMDAVVRDVFAGSITPAPLTTVEFARQAARVLRPGGVFLANCADDAALRLARSELATVGQVFPFLAACADPPMLKGRRRGNVVLAGSDRPIASAELVRDLLGGPAPAQLWDDERCRTFCAGAPVRADPP